MAANTTASQFPDLLRDKDVDPPATEVVYVMETEQQLKAKTEQKKG